MRICFGYISSRRADLKKSGRFAIAEIDAVLSRVFVFRFVLPVLNYGTDLRSQILNLRVPVGCVSSNVGGIFVCFER